LSRAAFEVLGDCGGLRGGNEEALLLDLVLRWEGIVAAYRGDYAKREENKNGGELSADV
jgi:hypothetical protein